MQMIRVELQQHLVHEYVGLRLGPRSEVGLAQQRPYGGMPALMNGHHDLHGLALITHQCVIQQGTQGGRLTVEEVDRDPPS